MRWFILGLIVWLFLPKVIHAQSEDQFVTIVNPVRISNYNQFPEKSLQAQYSIVSKYQLPATWLFTFDSLNNAQVMEVAKHFNAQQEAGIFLEISPQFASAASVGYIDSGSWHYANSVFLSGYTQADRIKLIDTVFEKYKSTFGHYPSSVGAWWVDAFSLAYMQNKYHITANLDCADQFSTDGYQIWGQYWSIPFYPSKYHAGIPAGTVESKLNVVTLQWAARDPARGYYSSIYSTQDYFTTPEKLPLSYFERLIKIYYAKDDNQFGQITLGLEGDFGPDTYSGIYSDQLSVVSKLVALDEVQATNMQEFSNWYRDKFPNLSPAQKIEVPQAVWFQSNKYRIAVLDHKIVDFRIYGNNLIEPYYSTPNTERILHINIPSLIDGVGDKQSVWNIFDSKPSFFDDYFTLQGNKLEVPDSLKHNPALKISTLKDGIKVEMNSKYLGDKQGDVLNTWTTEAVHAARSLKYWINFVTGKQRNLIRKINYSVSQEEISALMHLKAMPSGKVLVEDHECLQCSWYTQYKPAAFANEKSYIEKYSDKPIVYNQTIFNSLSRADARIELKKLKVKYVYLIKYSNYLEVMPFSPGDLGVEMIYENANAQIWQVK